MKETYNNIDLINNEFFYGIHMFGDHDSKNKQILKLVREKAGEIREGSVGVDALADIKMLQAQLNPSEPGYQEAKAEIEEIAKKSQEYVNSHISSDIKTQAEAKSEEEKYPLMNDRDFREEYTKLNEKYRDFDEFLKKSNSGEELDPNEISKFSEFYTSSNLAKVGSIVRTLDSKIDMLSKNKDKIITEVGEDGYVEQASELITQHSNLGKILGAAVKASENPSLAQKLRISEARKRECEYLDGINSSSNKAKREALEQEISERAKLKAKKDAIRSKLQKHSAKIRKEPVFKAKDIKSPGRGI